MPMSQLGLTLCTNQGKIVGFNAHGARISPYCSHECTAIQAVGTAYVSLLNEFGKSVAGQAVVQFATNKRSKEDCAIKFYLSMDAYREELQQYADAESPLREFLPRCLGTHDNTDGRYASVGSCLYTRI